MTKMAPKPPQTRGIAHVPFPKLEGGTSQVAGSVQAQFLNAGARPLPDDRLFQPFFRHAENQHVPGSGLGLSIVKQIAEQAGGSLNYAYNDAHRFTIALPVAV